MEQNKLSRRDERKKNLRYGGYQAGLCAVVLALCIGVNLLVGAIPSRYTQPDLSAGGLYTLSDTSRSLLKGLTQDITIYYLAQTGAEDQTIQKLLEVYDGASSRVKVVQKDPVLYPTFASQYTDETVYSDSCIVYNEQTGRSRFVGYYDLYLVDTSNYYTTGEYDWSFDGENALTSAIDYVTAETLPKLYTLTGHGELALDSELQSAIGKDNMELASLDLLSAGEIPEDCDALILYAPESDLSAAEADLLLTFLQNGGKLFLVTDYIGDQGFPNLSAVMANYGLELADGLVIEGDTGYSMRNYPHYLLPEIQDTDLTAALLSGGYRILAPLAQGLQYTEEYDEEGGTQIQALLLTSDSAYSKVAGYGMETMEKETGDLEGPFAIGAAVTHGQSRIVWYTTSMLFTTEINSYVSGANFDLALASLGWLADHESSISIHAKSLDYNMLTVPTADANRINLLMVVGLPLCCLLFGAVVCIKRKRG